MRRRAILAALVLALLALTAGALPAVATAQPGDTSPFSPGLPASPAPTPTVTTPTPVTPVTTSTGGGSLGGSGIAAITIGALVLLGGISLFIWHDARRRAPVRRMAAARSGEVGRSTTRRAKPRKLSPAERRRRKRGRAR